MNVNVSLSVLVECVAYGYDDLKKFAKKLIAQKYGENVAACVDMFLADGVIRIREDMNCPFLPPCDKELMIKTMDMIASNPKKKISMDSIYAMYHSDYVELVAFAKELVVKYYRQFCYHIMYKRFYTYAKANEEDMYQSCVVGLLLALDKFDPARGSFIPHAKKYIIHAAYQEVCHFMGDETSYYMELTTKIARAKQKLLKEGMEATAENISLISGIKESIVKREMEVEKRKQLVSYEDLIANDPKGIAGNTPIEDYVEYADLWKALESLPKMQKTILIAKKVYGYKVKEIAAWLGRSEQEIRNVLNEAIRHLKLNN